MKLGGNDGKNGRILITDELGLTFRGANCQLRFRFAAVRDRQTRDNKVSKNSG